VPFGSVTVPAESREDAVVVPETAVILSEDGFVAYVLHAATAPMRPVHK
jgi:hypothetical protein